MKPVREVQFEVLSKDAPDPFAQRDPFIAYAARLMDSVFTIPGTKIKFGLDPLIGLIPGFGDTISSLISIVLIARSSRLGVPKIILARMALNVLLNAGIGAIPVLGDLFSVFYQSNTKNYALLKKHAGAERKSTARDWLFIVGLLGALIGGIVLLVVGLITALSSLFNHN